MKRTILIVEDHPDVRAGLHHSLDEQPDLEVVGLSETAEEAGDQASRTQPDVIILDQRLPGMSGIDAIPHIKRVATRTRVIILTADPTLVGRALAAGADAVVEKGRPGMLATLIHKCRAEQNPITEG